MSNGGGGTLSWTAAIADRVDWARISSGSSGSNAGTVQIEIDPNLDDVREFELTVSVAGVASGTVAVRQADGRPAIEFSADGTELDGEGGSLTLQVRNTGIAPMQWSAALPDGVDWASIRSGEEGTDAGEIVVRYDLNGGFDRELSVRVTASAAVNSPQTLTLSQQWFASSACTFPEARAEFLELMKKWYYFNDDPEQQALYDGLDIDNYASLDAILEKLRSQPRDLFFSNWLTAARADRLFDGQYPSFGFFGWVVLTVNFNTGRQELLHYQVADVYADSPAGNAGLERGDRIVSLNGKRIDEMSNGPQVDEEMGPDEEGVEVSFEVEKQSGERLRFSMTKSLIDFPAVPEEHVRIFDTDAGRVGYVHFRGSVGDANERLLEEFAEFNAAGVRRLIVDLRYNAGGSVPIANGLATLIGGPELFENQTQKCCQGAFTTSSSDWKAGTGRPISDVAPIPPRTWPLAARPKRQYAISKTWCSSQTSLPSSPANWSLPHFDPTRTWPLWAFAHSASRWDSTACASAWPIRTTWIRGMLNYGP